jgi:hypothetical protein
LRIWTQRRTESETNHELLWGSLATIVILAAFVLPLLSLPSYPCLFLHLTGRPCPSCGSTRAFESAVRFNFHDAFQWNPLALVFFFALVLYSLYAWTVIIVRLAPLHVKLTHRWEKISLIVLVLAALLANWIYIWTSGMPYGQQ